MPAFIVGPVADSPYGNKIGSVVVHAKDATEAKERGATMLGLGANVLVAKPYNGPTLGNPS